jgi:hypothetical protein
MKPDIRQFTNNKMTQEEQLGLRIYNLEQYYGTKFIARHLMMALEKDLYVAFDDDAVTITDKPEHRMYLHSVQIIRYFGKELVTRFICFNYEKEMNEIKKAV